MNDTVLQWLLDNSDPAVRFRTLTELLGMDRSSDEVVATRDKLILSDNVLTALAFFDVGKAHTDAYAFSALAECGQVINNIVFEHQKNIYIINWIN